MLTGEKMRENDAVKADPEAHKHFGRIRKLMAVIGRDDALHEQIINRYCLLLSETEALKKEMSETEERIGKIRKSFEDGEIKAESYEAMMETALGQLLKLSDAIMKKRAMLLQIEKENLMTVASGLRAVPKKPEEEAEDPMEQLMRRVQMR